MFPASPRHCAVLLVASSLLGCGNTPDGTQANNAAGTAGVSAAGSGGLGVSSGGMGQGGGADNGGALNAGGDGSGNTSMASSMREACRLYVDAWCERSAHCNAGLTVEHCLAQEYPFCPDLFFSPGSTRTIDGLVACANDISQLSCADWVTDRQPTCVSPGTRAAGEACVFASQCLSLACSSNGDACGTCLAVVGLGEACDSTVTCAPGQQCNGLVCEIIPEPPPEQPAPPPPPTGLPQGASCGLMDSCAQGFWCLTSVPWPAMVPAGSQPGICDLLPAQGAPCAFERFASGASCAQGSYCDETSTCHSLPGTGEACLSYPLPECAQGFYCDRSTTAGTCSSQAAAGEACSASVPCLVDLDCVTVGAARMCQKVVEEGEMCTAPNTQCAAGTQCQGGICVATDALLTFSSQCGL